MEIESIRSLLLAAEKEGSRTEGCADNLGCSWCVCCVVNGVHCCWASAVVVSAVVASAVVVSAVVTSAAASKA